MQAIAQFAADERYRPMLPEVGALPGLQALLSSHLPHVQQCALSAIANTSFVPAAAAPLCATGVLAHLGQAIATTPTPHHPPPILTLTPTLTLTLALTLTLTLTLTLALTLALTLTSCSSRRRRPRRPCASPR